MISSPEWKHGGPGMAISNELLYHPADSRCKVHSSASDLDFNSLTTAAKLVVMFG